MERSVDEIRNYLNSKMYFKGIPDNEEWKTLLSWHPTYGSRMSEIKLVRVCKSRINQSVQLKISLNGRRFFTISWHACVKPPAPATLSDAMREAIVCQPRAWKRSQKHSHICATCGSNQNIQVDHKVVPFQDIMDGFMALGHTAPESTDWSYNPKTHAPRLPKGLFVQHWQRYHKERAQYQFLCRSCNSQKGRKTNYYAVLPPASAPASAS